MSVQSVTGDFSMLIYFLENRGWVYQFSTETGNGEQYRSVEPAGTVSGVGLHMPVSTLSLVSAASQRWNSPYSYIPRSIWVECQFSQQKQEMVNSEGQLSQQVMTSNI